MQLRDLLEEISTVVQDSSYHDTGLIRRINKAVLEIASGVRVPGLQRVTPPLPNLYVEQNIDLSEASRFVSLPDNYLRDVLRVYDSDNDRPVKVMASFQKFLKKSPASEPGPDISACVVHGQKLFYFPAYTKTVKIGFYEKPAALVDDTDEPACLPAHLHRDLIVNYVCSEIFSQIEDGMEGNKVNTSYHDNEFFKAILSLDSFIGVDGLPYNVGMEEDDGGSFNL